MAKAAPKTTNSDLSFEAALDELDTLVKTLEDGRMPLEESIGAYQRGMVLLRHCQDALAQAEQKIQILESSAAGDTLRNLPPTTEE